MLFCDGPEKVREHPGKKKPELPEDEAQVVAGVGQQRVDPVAIVAEQVVPAKSAVGLGMADHGLGPIVV